MGCQWHYWYWYDNQKVMLEKNVGPDIKALFLFMSLYCVILHFKRICKTHLMVQPKSLYPNPVQNGSLS